MLKTLTTQIAGAALKQLLTCVVYVKDARIAIHGKHYGSNNVKNEVGINFSVM